ncbi:ABC transporter ATP-binding protein [Methylotenera sp.]|uniref:ABC transporter ATP-binding protein n=4 Tax=Methylotenera sp. TaxID=2051956 RepID=UPI00273050CE|nr:ABC transporter ATP-binding protein [Methylotenera sp.]MDP1521853.1 ABC transporter ATP-binding protein [Methylotenera sp.]MDP2072081.1 ABC transporter ATP-binding protein [Methylotenera sp.]MDP3006909.1 ABC transporter ATP-binding protein [Methylotenera sp.]MDP3007154.1 ABC transporter ATP-binding protein [Methylotenera sp.]MDZ4211288.1 ABC transporter ATP-binding protein [Methylotenera sp.]
MLRWFENLLNPFPASEINPPPDALWPFVWACTKGSRRFILVMTLFTALIGGFEALLFAAMGKVVDWLSKTSPDLLWVTEKHHLLLLAVILLLSPILITIQSLIKHQTLAGNFPMRLRWNFHRLMLSQSMSFYQDEFAGRVAAKVMQTALAVRDVWFIVADILVFVVIYFVTMVAVVGHFNVMVMLPFLAWVILYIASLSYFVPRLAKVSQQQADARSLMTGRITDAYTNISTVKLFSHAGREASHAQSAMKEFLSTVHAQMRYVTGVEVMNHVLNMLLIIATSGVALWLWTKGEVSVGGVAAVTAMALRLNGISHWVMWEMTSLYEQIGTAQDGVNTLSIAHQITDAAEAKPLVVTAGDIKFEQVSFAYGLQSTVLEALNLSIRPGEKVGLVGRSGAGKSTIVNLLLRFYDVEQGRVLIDGQDIKQVTQNSLRSQIGMVTQDTSLLHRSVRDNILYGRPNATEAEMINAAKRAEAHDFILGLRDAKGRTAYDAHVGERGVKLSGGQRQRIAIARVMLKDAPILLLDEATSALDSEVEQAIQASLYNLMQGKTVVAIAHRLSTIAAMDRLIVLDEGKIAEEGNHQALLKIGGLYATFWAHQSGGFLGDD